MKYYDEFSDRRSDRLFTQLCDEVDYWRERAEIAEAKLKESEKRNSKMVNESIQSSFRNCWNMVAVACAVQERNNKIIEELKED